FIWGLMMFTCRGTADRRTGSAHPARSPSEAHLVHGKHPRVADHPTGEKTARRPGPYPNRPGPARMRAARGRASRRPEGPPMASGDAASAPRWTGDPPAGGAPAPQPLWEPSSPRLVHLARARLRAGRRAGAMADEEDAALSAFDSFCRGATQGRFPLLA